MALRVAHRGGSGPPKRSPDGIGRASRASARPRAAARAECRRDPRGGGRGEEPWSRLGWARPGRSHDTGHCHARGERDDSQSTPALGSGAPEGNGVAARSGGAVAGSPGPRCTRCGRANFVRELPLSRCRDRYRSKSAVPRRLGARHRRGRRRSTLTGMGDLRDLRQVLLFEVVR